jgi:hypothetical protein
VQPPATERGTTLASTNIGIFKDANTGLPDKATGIIAGGVG